MQKLSGKIVAIHQRRKEENAASGIPDDDPLMKRIGRRPDGSLEAISEKIQYSTQDGKKRVYIIISFMPVTGILDEMEVQVERPIEFFLPTSQNPESMQWISATMRNLSLAARGGYAVQALADLRQVTWDKGPVRCGVNVHGKPLYHLSEVAAIAWSIQQILYRRGFIDIDGNAIPTRELVAGATARTHLPEPPAFMDTPPAAEYHQNQQGLPECPECGGETVMLDGCESCPSCGFTRC